MEPNLSYVIGAAAVVLAFLAGLLVGPVIGLRARSLEHAKRIWRADMNERRDPTWPF